MGAPSLNQQINDYLEPLNSRQKKAILTIAKTFAEEQEIIEYSEAFKQELDHRYESYKSGEKLISETEADKRIKKILKAGKRK
ncbi:hypothetical protein [Chitinophaga japonensis]|uniref:Uncharacterized protein n=1 Tax=Chitinophaga japonensis TaxID=104662 RepID=A0A562T2S8_CHIJA|nr:hypothetical protein [Chitinophaga japonensis]TWI87872.1 hypothetical protein LX66_1946 [Chitinophaga japonensis]